jgi:hypothetical protein
MGSTHEHHVNLNKQIVYSVRFGKFASLDFFYQSVRDVSCVKQVLFQEFLIKCDVHAFLVD